MEDERPPCVWCKGPADVVTEYSVHAVSARGERKLEGAGNVGRLKFTCCVACLEDKRSELEDLFF